MYKEIYGFDPDVFSYGTAIRIEDSIKPLGRNVLLSYELPNDYSREKLTGNYLVKDCYITELRLTNVFGKEYIIPLEFVNGENPRLLIEILEQRRG